MDYLIFVTIGISMGFLGGLLGIGGSIVMIPALVFAFGENQHLYQASAMICNFFVGSTAVIVHKKAKVLMPEVIKWLVPSAALGIIAGVAISNTSVFARENSYLLARLFGVFTIYVVVYNCFMFNKRRGGNDGLDISNVKRSIGLTILCGLMSGTLAGLLGLGGGVICVPGQQLLLKMPLKRAIANSAAMIASIALVGALYKNITLSQHNIAMQESVKMAAVVIPSVLVGSFLGSHAVHKLHTNIVRIIFIAIAVVASYKMLTV